MNHITFILTLINITYFITCNYISFPFHRNISKKYMTTDNIINILIENKIYIELEIGTPIQKIPMFLKLREYITFITSDSCENKIIKFFPKDSSSIKYITEEKKDFPYHCKEGLLISEKITLNKKPIENFNLGLANKLSNNAKEMSGEIGLKLNKIYNNILENATFIQQLKEKKIIDNYSFYLKYTGEDEGEFIIGNYPHEYNKSYDERYLKLGKIGASNVYKFPEWEIEFDNIYSGNNDISYQKIGDLFYEYGLIIGTRTYYEDINYNYFKYLIENNTCSQTILMDYFVFICDKNLNLNYFPLLNFVLKNINFNFTFNGHDLFYEFKDYLYFQIIFTRSSSVRWILGKQFFQKYQIILDRDKRTFGIYTSISNNTSTLNFNWIIIIILLIALIICVFYIRKLIKGKRKIRANELEEHYEYVSNINENNRNSNLIYNNE